MKKLLAVLSAAGLTLGVAGVFGATAATAQQTFAITVSKTTNLSMVGPTTLTVQATGASEGDAIEAGVCNDDASQTSPLVNPSDACAPPKIVLADADGDATLTFKLKLGLQGSDALSGCPQSSQQYGLGVQCIVASADLTSGATADVPLYFKFPKGTASGVGFNGVLTVSGGFAVAGVSGNPPSTTGCQSFSSTAPAASWTGIPLCDDGADAPSPFGPVPEGDGYAGGEPVEVVVNGTLVCDPTDSTVPYCPNANADAPVDVANPGGATFDFTFPASGRYTIQFVGAESGVVNTFTAKVSMSGVVS
jgi:hypothetical protein